VEITTSWEELEELKEGHTLPTIFFRKVAECGDRVALRKKEYGIWNNISWREYGDYVKWVCSGLISLGLQKGERVSIISETRPEWLFIDLAIQSAGGITVPIYQTCSAPQVEYILQHSEARFLFVEDEEQLDKYLEIREHLPHLKKVIVVDLKGLRYFRDPAVLSFKDLLDLGRAHESRGPTCLRDCLRSLKAEGVATIVYTSGTTGPPKGAMMTHRNIILQAKALLHCLGLRETDEVLSYLPLSHIGERIPSLFLPLIVGYTLNFAENMETVPQDLREISPDFFFGVPRIWEKFYSNIALEAKEATWFKRQCYGIAFKLGKRLSQYKLAHQKAPTILSFCYFGAHWLVFRKLKEMMGLDRARLTICGAAPVSPEILEFFLSLGIPMKITYGITEAAGVVTMHQGDDIKVGTVGRPLPGLEVKVNEDGEILVKGPIFTGYYKDPELTKDTIVDGWLHTGDIGTFDEGGHLKITDRKKDILITAGGKNVAPQYIENLLKFSPYIQDAVVIGDGRKYLAALIIIDEETVTHYAQDHRIPFTTYADLSQNAEIYKLISGEVEKVNDKLARVESIKKFKILDKNLDQEDGELTPTLKVKRKFISDRFKELIESMYQD
jgi:long-chain acyl-CoA synthetase